MLSIYPACFFKEENAYSVVFPDLNWLATYGNTFENAMEMAIECLAGYLYSCKIDGDELPPASNLSDIDSAAIAKELAITPKETIVNMVSVDVAAFAKQNFEKSVKKTLTIPAWLNAAALEMNLNFSQILQEALLAKIRAK